MFHLFDKVYLTFDHNISTFENRMVFSNVSGIGDGSLTTSKLKLFAQSIDDIVGKDKQFAILLELFKHIKTLTDDKLIIYCDTASFLKLFIGWHKTVLTQTNSDSVWQNLMLYTQKESFLSSITEQSSHVYFDAVKPSSWDRQTFDEIYTLTKSKKDLNWNNSILSSLGIELLISSYLQNKSNESVKTALKNKIKILIDRVMQDEFYDSKISIMSNTFNSSLYDSLGINHNEELNMDVFDNELLCLYNDPEIWRENLKMTASSSSGAINLKIVPLEKLQRLIALTKDFRHKFQKCGLDSFDVQKLDWVLWVVDEFTDEELDNFLNDELSSEMLALNDKRQVNFLFVGWVLNQYKVNGATALSNYNIAL
jgi:hypothetical protein